MLKDLFGMWKNVDKDVGMGLRKVLVPCSWFLVCFAVTPLHPPLFQRNDFCTCCTNLFLERMSCRLFP